QRGIAGMAVRVRALRPGLRLLLVVLALALAGVAAVGVAVARRAGVHAFGHVPGPERGGVALGQRLRAFLLALFQRLLHLLGRLFAADRQRALRLAATAAALLAHVVEAAQLAALVGGVHAVHICLAARLAGEVQGCLRGLALADDRQQRQCRRGAFLEAEFPAQRLHVCRRQFLRLAAQQRAGQGDAAVADALEPRDLAALRFPHPADLAVAAFVEHHAEPVVRAGAADALDLVELRRT